VVSINLVPKLKSFSSYNRKPLNYSGKPEYNEKQRDKISTGAGGKQPVELSCKSGYALLALIALSDHYGDQEPLQIRQIAAQQTIPDRYLEQLLATLRRAGLVRSLRGAKGGYVLAREPWQITVLEVITCIEGKDITSATALPITETVEKMVVQESWQKACESMRAVLKTFTLQDLCDRRELHRPSEPMYYI
jgi:Rrf2 family transcriptional regulator, cysteine metabolism repressor